LRSDYPVQEAHAVLLGGGSAFGLAAAEGVMAHLRDRGVGIDTHVARVPIVPAAVMFDPRIGRPDAYPTTRHGPISGRGSGDGLRVGVCGSWDGGNGGEVRQAGSGHQVGDRDGLREGRGPGSGSPGSSERPRAGGRRRRERARRGSERREGWLDVREILKSNPPEAWPIENKSLAMVGTNANLTKAQVKRVAMMAQDGLARSIFPVHTLFDGDSVFALASGKVEAEPSLVGAWAADALAEAVRRAVLLATGAGGIPAVRELEEG
jgi:L-aminopeptidase/D-esterase-like protein